ncbi:MAG: GntR family transcriptional regulator [Eubacterium sp.]|jgi:DNA-binding transcriptional regulator YhcF (GntR family)/CheY-like chemotaxis protein
MSGPDRNGINDKNGIDGRDDRDERNGRDNKDRMRELYRVDTSLDIPIYRQIVDVITADIKSGKLPAGAQLPTVRDLADTLGIARGTIKRSYDELESIGIVEKIRGRGTFVKFMPASSESRKDRAMAAIDTMFDELEAMNLPMQEIEIFLSLKLKEREANMEKVKVGVVDCNPEVLLQIDEQLRDIGGIDIYTYILDDIRKYPYKLGEDMDLIVTTITHAEELSSIVSQSAKIAKIALTLMPPAISGIVKLAEGSRAAILCQSERFGTMISKALDDYGENLCPLEPVLFRDPSRLAKTLKSADALIVPEKYEKLADGETLNKVEKFAEKHPLVVCGYRIDAGSYVYLKDKVERLRNAK